MWVRNLHIYTNNIFHHQTRNLSTQVSLLDGLPHVSCHYELFNNRKFDKDIECTNARMIACLIIESGGERMVEDEVTTNLFIFVYPLGRIYYSGRRPVPAHLLSYDVTVRSTVH